jgi:hypothetical protein
MPNNKSNKRSRHLKEKSWLEVVIALKESELIITLKAELLTIELT